MRLGTDENTFGEMRPLFDMPLAHPKPEPLAYVDEDVSLVIGCDCFDGLEELDGVPASPDTPMFLEQQIGSLASSISEGVQAADSVVKTGRAFVKERPLNKTQQDMQGAANAIRSVTRSPATHIALGVMASAVPVGTAAAAVAEVGLAVAEGVAWAISDGARFFEDVGKELENAWCGIFDCGRPNPAEIEAKKRKEKKERQRKRQHTIKVTYPNLARKMAATYRAAQSGDVKAQGIMTALAVEMSGNAQRAKIAAALKSKGYPKEKIVPEAKRRAKNIDKDWKLILSMMKAEAAKLPPLVVPPEKRPRDITKTKAIIQNATHVAALKIARTLAQTPDGVSGVLVDVGGRKRGSGRFLNGTKGGVVGWVVRPDGRIITGVFS